MRRDQERGSSRKTARFGSIASALKIGTVGAAIITSAYLAHEGDIPRSPIIAFEDSIPDADAHPAEVALQQYADQQRELNSWLGIDPGEFRRSETGPEPEESVTAEDDTEQDSAEQRVVMVRRGDTLLDLLLNAGIPRAEAHEAVSALRGVFNPRELRPGQEITLMIKPLGTGEQPGLVGASFAANAERDINLSRDSDGRFTALGRDRDLRRELVRTTGTVRSSLFEAGSTAGVPGTIMVELIRALSYDVDFQRDIQPGDTFDLVFERFRDEDGRIAKDGNVLYGALTLSGNTKRVYRYVLRDGTVGYFNELGENVRKALLRTPIDGARLTSGFGTRTHPILGYSAMHKGVDFGAPQGTPIQAAGDGIVESAGRNGSYGLYVRIRHNSEYASAYAHLSRIATDVRQGERVRQGQVIGYVGSTGRSTGPHLHYEVMRRGTQINPLNVQLPTVRKLEGPELIQFRTAKADLDIHIAGLEPTGRVARANADTTSTQ